jgi:hypothetical protein
METIFILGTGREIKASRRGDGGGRYYYPLPADAQVKKGYSWGEH